MPWRELPETYGRRTTCCSLFAQYRHLGSDDGNSQVIESTSIRAQQLTRGKKSVRNHCLGRCRGEGTTKIRAVVDEQGFSIRLRWAAGQSHAGQTADDLLDDVEAGMSVLADKAYIAGRARTSLHEKGALANMSPKSNPRLKRDAALGSKTNMSFPNTSRLWFNDSTNFNTPMDLHL